MKVITIADTHGKHEQLKLPSGDVLIHAGDISMTGQVSEIADFLSWFKGQDYSYKILIAGNHDFFFERESDDEIKRIIPEGVIYLKDSGTEIEGFRFWGSPVTPWFFNWAFNRGRGEPIRRHWDLIPVGTDILVTHGPVFRTLDQNKRGEHVGCKDLFVKVQEVRPKVHICGHIHESHGTVDKMGIKFINASILNEEYELVNAPIEFQL